MVSFNMPNAERVPLSIGRVVTLVVSVVVLLAVLIGAGNLFESVAANEIVCIQSPVSGALTFYRSPGIKWQGFGTVTRYSKRSQYWFSNKADQGDKSDQSIKVRFNDGGHATLSGSIAWEMPIDESHLTALHTKYGSQDAIQTQLVRTVVERAVYMTGPLMSSKESYAERRNELLQDIEDQIQNGVYLTKIVPVKQIDPTTNQEKTVAVVQTVATPSGQIARADESPLKTFGIRTFNPSLNEIKYDDTVEKQIQSQQSAIMAVQTAIAESKQAEQRALTVAKNGEADAAKAKWEQEVIKAKEVTAAEQRKEVARLDAEAAELKKKEQTLLGEGEAARRRAVMLADGALDKKLSALVEINKMYAQAIAGHPLVPSIVMGQTGGNGGNGALSLIDLLTAKTARDLGVDLNTQGRDKTQ